MLRHLACVAGLVLVLSGCGPARIDGSSEAAFKASIDRVKAPLTLDEKRQFEASVGLLTAEDTIVAADKDGAARLIRDTLHGKTAQEAIAAAQALVAKKKADEKADADAQAVATDIMAQATLDSAKKAESQEARRSILESLLQKYPGTAAAAEAAELLKADNIASAKAEIQRIVTRLKDSREGTIVATPKTIEADTKYLEALKARLRTLDPEASELLAKP